MSLLQINIESLFSKEMQMECPHNADRLADVIQQFHQWTGEKSTGPIYSGYRQQILSQNGLSQARHVSNDLRKNFDTMVVVGIGGSALGARTGLQALQWSVPIEQRKTVHIIDNLDPIEFETVWQKLNLEKTCFAIISKSGTTLETIAQLSVILQRLTSNKIPLEKHLVAITDPNKGALRHWASSMEITCLDLPSDVGGRFSVLSPVGLLPLAFAGINIQSLMEGAISQVQNSKLEDLARFALRLSELENSKFNGHVLMPYSSCLKEFGSWFVQLWGESLGKSRDDGSTTGPIPVAAVGDTDQHSILQLLVEGSNNLITGFMRIEKWPQDYLTRPNVAILPPEFAALSYATRKTFWEILNAQQKATAQVLRERSRPIYEIIIDSLNEQSLGACFALYMDLVTLTASAHNINPFNQPGVEKGKQLVVNLLNP